MSADLRVGDRVAPSWGRHYWTIQRITGDTATLGDGDGLGQIDEPLRLLLPVGEAAARIDRARLAAAP